MPKLKTSAREEANRIVQACIANNMELYGVSEDELATRLGIVKKTLQNKRKRPEIFTFDELRNIAQILKFTPIQNASILSGKAITSKNLKEFILL